MQNRLRWLGRMTMREIPFKRHRFRPDVIRYAIWLYYRFTLRLRDVENLLAERGIDVSYEGERRVPCQPSSGKLEWSTA